MKTPKIDCPAGYPRRRVTDGEWVVVCRFVAKKMDKNEETYPNYEVVVSHCQNYTKCQIWREEKDKDWMKKFGKKYTSIAQGEKIYL